MDVNAKIEESKDYIDVESYERCQRFSRYLAAWIEGREHKGRKMFDSLTVGPNGEFMIGYKKTAHSTLVIFWNDNPTLYYEIIIYKTHNILKRKIVEIEI